MELNKIGNEICFCENENIEKTKVIEKSRIIKSNEICKNCIEKVAIYQTWKWVQEYHKEIFITEFKIPFVIQKLFFKRILKTIYETDIDPATFLNEKILFVEWIHYLFFSTSFVTGERWNYRAEETYLHWDIWKGMKDLDFDNLKERLSFYFEKELSPSAFHWLNKMIQLKIKKIK